MNCKRSRATLLPRQLELGSNLVQWAVGAPRAAPTVVRIRTTCAAYIGVRAPRLSAGAQRFRNASVPASTAAPSAATQGQGEVFVAWGNVTFPKSPASSIGFNVG